MTVTSYCEGIDVHHQKSTHEKAQSGSTRLDPILRTQIQSLVRGFSIEVTVREARGIEDFRPLLPVGSEVYIVATPTTRPGDVVLLARRLRDAGMIPIPHVAARAVRDTESLEEWIGLLASGAGVRAALVIAGGTYERPHGPFDSSLALVRSGLLERHGVRDIRFAAHPEGHPLLNHETLMAALIEKQAYGFRRGFAPRLVTQFFFDAEPVIRWDRMLQQAGITLPTRVGLHGLASVASLLKQARYCGVGPSIHALTAWRSNLMNLARSQAPDRLLHRLARHTLEFKSTRIAGCHFFPFGNFKATARWASAIAEGRFELHPSGTLRVYE